MTTKKAKQIDLSKYIFSLYMNGLRGRMMVVPPADKKSTQEILMVYGQASDLEYWFEIASDLSRYGRVTMPDLPGMGGMEDFYKIHNKASIETLADYLASFIKLRYKRKRVSLIGYSFGFVVITKMLQKYPELVRKVDLLFGVSSLAHHDDIKLSKRRVIQLRLMTRVFSTRLFARLYRWIYLDSFLSEVKLRKEYQRVLGLPKSNRKKLDLLVNSEIDRRKKSSTRTYMAIYNRLLSLDNCQQRINLTVWHVSGAYDEYLDNKNVEQHLKIIFHDYNHIKLTSRSPKHKPASIKTLNATDLVPIKARSLLKSNMFKQNNSAKQKR